MHVQRVHIIITVIIFISLFHLRLLGKTIRLAYEDKELYPYYSGNGASTPQTKPGISIELLQLVEQELSVKFVFIRAPWKRCKWMLENGEVDGIFNASFKEERLKIGVYPHGDNPSIPDMSKRITTLRYRFYVNKNNTTFFWDGKNIVNKSQNKIAAILGYSVVNDLQKLGVPVHEYYEIHVPLKLLNTERIPAYVDLETKVDHLLGYDNLHYSNIVSIDPPFKEKHYYLLISKQFFTKDENRARALWRAIEKVRKSKKFSIVKQKYYHKND